MIHSHQAVAKIKEKIRFRLSVFQSEQESEGESDALWVHGILNVLFTLRKFENRIGSYRFSTIDIVYWVEQSCRVLCFLWLQECGMLVHTCVTSWFMQAG